MNIPKGLRDVRCAEKNMLGAKDPMISHEGV